jgi:hypothetical protein
MFSAVQRYGKTLRMASKRAEKEEIGFFPRVFRENPLRRWRKMAYFAAEIQIIDY